jgi:hypothetical protein
LRDHPQEHIAHHQRKKIILSSQSFYFMMEMQAIHTLFFGESPAAKTTLNASCSAIFICAASIK